MSSDVETGGGASIGRDVNTGGGNFAGRDDRPLSINVNTAEWRESVAAQLLIQDQRISELEMSAHFQRQRERMTNYQSGGKPLALAMGMDSRQATAWGVDSFTLLTICVKYAKIHLCD